MSATLSVFLQQLFTDGNIVISGTPVPSAPDEAGDSQQLLQSIYEEDIQHLPTPVPAYDADAAMWAAQYLYATVQAVAVREIETEKLAEMFPVFTVEKTAAAIYAADLTLRYLPQLLHLAKGLAPADALVNLLMQTAQQWPFSSVGVPLPELRNERLILQHPGLRIAYADRIIQAKDLTRVQHNPAVQAAVQEVMGHHTESFWPTFTLHTV